MRESKTDKDRGRKSQHRHQASGMCVRTSSPALSFKVHSPHHSQLFMLNAQSTRHHRVTDLPNTDLSPPPPLPPPPPSTSPHPPPLPTTILPPSPPSLLHNLPTRLLTVNDSICSDPRRPRWLLGKPSATTAGDRGPQAGRVTWSCDFRTVIAASFSPGALCYGVSARTGWPGVSIQ